MAFGSPFLFSGTTVWHTAIRVRNSRITGAVTCGEHHKVTKFTVLRRGTLHVLAGTIYPECKKSELTWFLFKFSISDGSLKPCTSSSPHLEKTKHTVIQIQSFEHNMNILYFKLKYCTDFAV